MDFISKRLCLGNGGLIMFCKNIKTGSLYQIWHFATDTTNSRDGESVVVYYAVNNPEKIFVRNEEEFFKKFRPVSDGGD